mmetsp:Transcript_2225/g.5263  ORF Transcript_2225/g.5263 Transcript_2225/m.5263 type:complete len:103 (+) Transcript_2225:455-763(+)
MGREKQCLIGGDGKGDAADEAGKKARARERTDGGQGGGGGGGGVRRARVVRGAGAEPLPPFSLRFPPADGPGHIRSKKTKPGPTSQGRRGGGEKRDPEKHSR